MEEDSVTGADREAGLFFPGYPGEQLQPFAVDNSTRLAYRESCNGLRIGIITIPHSDHRNTSTCVVEGDLGLDFKDYIIFGHGRIVTFQFSGNLSIMCYSQAHSRYITSRKKFTTERAVRYQVDWVSGRILVPSARGWKCERLTV